MVEAFARRQHSPDVDLGERLRADLIEDFAAGAIGPDAIGEQDVKLIDFITPVASRKQVAIAAI